MTTKPLTLATVRDIKEEAEKATQGPWRVPVKRRGADGRRWGMNDFAWALTRRFVWRYRLGYWDWSAWGSAIFVTVKGFKP